MSVSSTTVPKTLVIGARSFIGKRLLAAYRQEYPDLLGTHYQMIDSHYIVDLLCPELFRLGIRFGEYAYAVICAGNPRVLACEQEKTYSFRINVEGPLLLAKQLLSLGITPIVFSSDYVFDGAEGGYDDDAKTNPINEYGRQKEALEQQIEHVCGGNYLLIRCSKVFGLERGDGSFIDQIVALLYERKKVYAAYDQVFNPIFIGDVVHAIIDLQQKGCRGRYNLCGSEIWTRFELAQEIAAQLGCGSHLIERVSLDDLPHPYRLPKQTYMVPRKFSEISDIKLTLLSDSIQALSL